MSFYTQKKQLEYFQEHAKMHLNRQIFPPENMFFLQSVKASTALNAMIVYCLYVPVLIIFLPVFGTLIFLLWAISRDKGYTEIKQFLT